MEEPEIVHVIAQLKNSAAGHDSFLENIMDFLDTNNILYDKQFGYRKLHSTSLAIITFVDKVSRALDTGKFIVGVFLDLKKKLSTQ